MGSTDMLFLFGLGVVYAVAFRLVRNGLVLWPLLTPLGSFFANLEAGEIDLPWAAIAGFVDVAAIMTTLVVIAHRRQRHLRAPIEPRHDTTTDDPDHSGRDHGTDDQLADRLHDEHDGGDRTRDYVTVVGGSDVGRALAYHRK